MIALTRSCARGAAAASNAATATANALPGVRVAPSPLLLRRRGAAIIRTTGVDRSMSSGTATAAAAVPPHIAAASHFDEDALQVRIGGSVCVWGGGDGRMPRRILLLAQTGSRAAHGAPRQMHTRRSDANPNP